MTFNGAESHDSPRPLLPTGSIQRLTFSELVFNGLPRTMNGGAVRSRLSQERRLRGDWRQTRS